MEKEAKTQELPLLALRGVFLVYPTMVIHLDVGRRKSIQALESAMMGDQVLFLVTQKEVAIEDPEPEDLYHIGTVAKINQMIKLPNGTMRILVEGMKRGEIVKFIETEDEFVVEIEERDDVKYGDHEEEALMRQLVAQFEEYIKVSRKVTKETLATVVDIDDPSRLTYMIAAHVPMKIKDRQSLIEVDDLKERMKQLLMILANEKKVLDLERKIGKRVQSSMERNTKRILFA